VNAGDHAFLRNVMESIRCSSWPGFRWKWMVKKDTVTNTFLIRLVPDVQENTFLRRYNRWRL
jgi:hypothetical protein